MKAKTIEAMYAFWRGWFAQSAEEKDQHSKLSGRGGYYPPFSEAPGYGKPEPKEYYHFRAKDFGKSLHTAAAFQECYQTALNFLSRHAFGLFPALTFPPDGCVLRVIRYPALPEGAFSDEHRDYDLLTVSVPGTSSGLEVKSGDQWVPSEEGVQVGEMLEIYTAAKNAEDPSSPLLPGTLHRVRGEANVERYKAVFFYLPPMDFVLRPGLTAFDYLLAEPGKREDGWVGVLKRAGTAEASKVVR